MKPLQLSKLQPRVSRVGAISASVLLLAALGGCAQHTTSYDHRLPAAPVATEEVVKTDPTSRLPFRAAKYLTAAPFKMPDGFPRTPDAFGDRKTLKGSDVKFYSRLSLEKIKDFYRSRMTKYGLVEVNPNSATIDECMIIEFSGWPTRERIEISSCDEAFFSTNNQRSVSARFRWKEE